MAELDGKTLKNLDQALQDMNTHLNDLDQWLKKLKNDCEATFDERLIKSWSESIKKIDFSKITKEQLKELQKQISETEKSFEKATTNKRFLGVKIRNNDWKYDFEDVQAARQFLDLLKQINAQQTINIANSAKGGVKYENTAEAQRYLETQKKIGKQHRENKATLDSMLPTLQRLASAFGVAFSVRGLAQFGKKLIETRGEFEMQFVAMKQIIGDVDAATKIWNQTMQQALQSPFKAMQLVTYTKQLAAYRIETEKLFDTTKRLADISAGLGVDMGRLILAFGQVKSANFLRASEVRQFTEAGVNIVGNLAQYFTELEGRSVGTAEVMERITKRMVLFSDVEAIFKRMTDEGGEFYNMQEVQADTVKGQVQKLHDAYDQMLNTIGQANQGTIRNFVDTLNNLVRNWQDVAFVLKANINWITIFGASLYALSNKYMKGATTQTLWFSKALTGNGGVLLKEAGAVRLFGNEVGLLSVKQRIGVIAMRSFQGAIMAVGKALSTLWPLLVFEGITLLVERLTRANRELKRFREELQEVASTNVGQMDDEINGYDTLIKKLKQTTEGTMARKEVLDEISRRYGKYIDFIITEKTTVEELAGAYDKVVSSIRNYTAEKIREEQQQRLEKGLYDEYQDLINNLTGANVQFEGGWANLSKSQAKNIAKLVEKSLKETGAVDLQSILEKYLGLDFDDASYERINYFVEGVVNSYVKAYKGLSGELQEIRDDIEGTTPVFASEAEYEAYKRNVEAANAAILEQNKQYEERVRLTKETFRDTSEQWIIDDKIAKLRLENEEEVLRIRKEYGLVSEGQYNDELARLHGVLDTYEQDYNKRLETAMVSQYGIFWQTTNKEARDMYNFVVSTEQALQQGTSQRNKQLKESYKGFKDSLEQYNTQFEAAVNSGASKEALDKIQADIDLAKLMMTAIELAANLRGIDLSDKKKTTTRTTRENASKLISLIKEMRSEYDKLSKSAYGYAKSEEKVRDSYRDSVKAILGKAGVTEDYDFTTNEGMIAALDKVLAYANKLGPEAAAEVQKYIDQLETEIEINAQVRIREDFGKQMEKAFGDYELTLELDNLNISPESAKNLFPEFDSQTLGELQDAMQEFYQKQGDSFDEEDLKVYKQWSDKIDAEILKSRKEKAKQYSKYLEKEYSERAKVEMQYAKDVAFVTANFNGEQQQNILKGIEDKYQKDINELTWKSFKESAFYVEMMDDLSSVPSDYMKIMLSKIEELLAHPETLSPRALKEAINARQKILEAQMDINSISVMKESLKDMREAANDVDGKTWAQTKKRLDEEQTAQAEKLKGLEEEIRCYEELQGQLKGLEEHDEAVVSANRALPEDIASILENTDIDTIISEYRDELSSLSVSEGAITSSEKDANAEIQARIEYLQRIIPLLVDYRTALNERAAYQATDAGQNALFARGGGETSSSVGETITQYKKEADEASNRLSELKKWQKAFKNFSDGMSKWNAAVSDAITKVGAMGSAFYDTFDALGGETNTLTEGWKEFGNTMVQTITQALALIPQLVAGFVAAGTSINAAMGLIGLIAEAIQLVLVAVGTVAKLHDAHYEREIEKQQDKIDDLNRAYERLEKSIEKTFDTVSYMKEYNKEVQNLYEQYEALTNQIQAEEAKKNTDKDKLQDYQDKQQEILDTLEEIKQAQIEVFGGIGEESYRSAAEGFVDAWKSAFLETGDGLQGLQDHFDEFLQDWFVKQATMQGVAKYYQKVFDYINGVVEDGSVPTYQQIENARLLADEAALKSDELMQAYASIFGLGGEGSLSGLAAGIQGMTEEQANILEAYWNSVRGYTASIDMNVARIAEILGGGSDMSNPQLTYLESIARNTGAIYSFLQSVAKSGHAESGMGIKVFVN